MKRLFVLIILFFFTTIFSLGQNAWINELHYDNGGGDVGEFLEVVIEDPSIYSLSDFTVVLYNGANSIRRVYDSESIDQFVVGDTEGDYTFYTWTPSIIENGSPDGLALVYNGSVIQFLSYEGAFVALDGPASGMTSTDIGVTESSSTSIGHSLQLGGTGLQYAHFVWNDPDTETPGSLNHCQLLSTASAVNLNLMISEVTHPDDNANAKFVELYNSGTTPINFCEYDWYISVRNHSGSWSDIRLGPGIIQPNETWVIAKKYLTTFYDAYGIYPDQEHGNIDGNGDDAYVLFYNGGHSSGTLIDIYGLYEDGTGTLWEYTNSKATRKRHINSPNNIWDANEWVIVRANVSNMTPLWHNKELRWLGSNLNWNDNSNWEELDSTPATYAPDAGCDIVIPSTINNPTISGRASCNNMTINSGAVVTINAQNFLVTGSSITNNAGVSGLIVKSDASGDGMLLLGSETVQATIERYLIDDQSHLISAPITDATADNLFQDHNPEVYLYEHNEWDDSWQYLVPTDTDMTEGKGFSTWVDNASPDFIIADFDGTLISADLTLSNSTFPALEYSSDVYGWNLIGNPYSVPLDWDRGDWDTTNIEGTIWVWDPVLDDYLWRNSFSGGTLDEGIIPMGQAFFIRTQNNSPSITIPANARSVFHNDIGYYKQNERNDDTTEYFVDHIIIYAQNQLHTDEVWISFSETGTENFDNGWDVSKVKNTNRTVSVYVPKEYRNQCLEHLPTLLPDEERIVDVGFETTADGEHSLVIDATYMPDTDITLEDMKYNQMQNMDSDSIYTFVAFADDDPNRFRIHFNKTTTGIEFDDFNQQTDPSVQIYSYDKNVYIKKEDASSSGYVMFYDMYGREVLSKQLEQSQLMKIPVQLNNSYLVVKVISGNKVFTSKVYIK